MKAHTTTFYIARHGKTDWNTKGLIQGHKDSHLTIVGEEQAKGLAEELKEIHFDVAFSSDLLRAKRTAEIISLDRNLVVKTTELIRERTYGTYEGLPYDTMKTYDAFLEELTKEQKFIYKKDGVESDEELISRMTRFIRETAVIYSGKTVLVVSHGDTMHKFLIHLGFGTYTNFPVDNVGNCAYFVLETDGADFKIKNTVRIITPYD